MSRYRDNTFTIRDVHIDTEVDVEVGLDDIKENVELSELLDGYDDQDGTLEWVKDNCSSESIADAVIEDSNITEKVVAYVIERAKAGETTYSDMLPNAEPVTIEPVRRETSVEPLAHGTVTLIRAGFENEIGGMAVIGCVCETNEGWQIALRLSGTTKRYVTAFETDAMQLVKALVAWDDLLIADRYKQVEQESAMEEAAQV